MSEDPEGERSTPVEPCVDPPDPNGAGGDAQVVNRLQRIVEEEDIDHEFVSQVAAVDLGRAEETPRLARLRRERGHRFHADLLFQLTQQYYPFEEAERLWRDILAHRRELERLLGRDPGLAVAALDHQTNVCNELVKPKIVPEDQLESMAERALRDPLTRLYDRRTFESTLHTELRRVRRYGNELAVALLDLDDFKRINDTHGHLVGDQVLQRVSRALSASVRDIDLVSRYGGEEFTILLPQTGKGEAMRVSERLRRAVTGDPAAPAVTLSIGVAVSPEHGQTRGALLKAADDALYRAKAGGKNRVVLAG